MTINQMRYYAAVCRCGNMTKAASELFVSQPALSKAIKEIERECGTALFVRTGNSISLTEEGAYLYNEIQDVLFGFNKLEKKVHNHQLSRNHIRLSYSVLSGFSSYKQILSEFLKRFPDVGVRASINNTLSNYNLLDANKVDLILTTRKAGTTDEMWKAQTEYGYWPVKLNELVFCVHRDNPLSRSEYINWDDIATCKLILMGGSFSVGNSIESRLKAMGVYSSANVQFTEQIYVALELIRNNMACGFFHKDLIDGIEEIVGVPSVIGNTAQSYLIWKNGTPLFWAASEFIKIAKELYPGQR